MRQLAMLLGALVVVLIGVACSAPDSAMRVSELSLNDAPPKARMRAGYFELTNPGHNTRRLVSVKSNGFGLAEIHRTETIDGVARMREIPELLINPGETLRFEPFGRHVMLMRAISPALPDKEITVTLCFDDEQCVTARAADTP